ncbi:carbohydrate-binding protein [Pedobacter yulinensis]|uniref:Carbohydrate-binding protein n=1 Tax=Pedobacter yulinensis TaxID=2126353 RepID=A0A2T3HP52_9SPHI|nr:DUF4185 domain-containing protein [Pedobacter yulinensis]PST84161.1 carbohydrate-binding protein [Pedobacter yulinensis]
MSRFFLILSYIYFLFTLEHGARAQRRPSAIRITQVARVTGRSMPGEKLPNPNQTHQRYNLGGTDLGIAWQMGNGNVGIWFGDSYGRDFIPVPEGGPGKAGAWRSNVLAFSSDRNLANGLQFDSMYSQQGSAAAAEVIFSPHQTDGKGSHTAIPTAAIHAAGKEYVHYMDVRKWLGPGRWATNVSGLYVSDNAGRSWQAVKDFSFGNNSNFAQAGFAAAGGYVYIMGTPAGRWGRVRLARVKERHVEDQHRWEYRNKLGEWVRGREEEASDLFSSPAGELSLAWHPQARCWLLTYLNEQQGALVLRRADSITGPWSDEQVLASYKDFPGLYGAFIYPHVEANGFYFLLSVWKPYNVFLMHAAW